MDITAPLARPTTQLRAELEEHLAGAAGKIRQVYAIYAANPTAERKVYVEQGAAANTGAAGNVLWQVRAVLSAELPTSPSIATQCASKVRALLSQRDGDLSDEAVAYLERLRDELQRIAGDSDGLERDVQRIADDSEELAETVEVTGGVYVYTYPHYLRAPIAERPERFLLKVRFSDRTPAKRVLEQARTAAVPEEPVMVRVYRHPEMLPRELESVIQGMLVAAGHDHPNPDRKAGGREWYATTSVFLDAVADLVGAETVQADLS